MSEQASKQPTPEPLSAVAERYYLWGEAEQQCAPETLIKRRDCLRQVVRIIGDKPVVSITKEHVLTLKADLVRRNLSPSRQYQILATLKYFLRYCEEVEEVSVFPSEAITFP
jgi:site-specific recombinase XerD